MAVCWSFAMVLLLLTLAALVAPGQPLFQPPASTHHKRAREISKASIEHHFNSIPAVAHVGSEDIVRRSSNVLVGRRSRFRRLLERGAEFACDERLNCRRRVDPERARTREILANYRLPQQQQQQQQQQQRRPMHFQSERMVPTGPNPLHNSNRSQVIFP